MSKDVMIYLWSQLQKAESGLMQAIRVRNPEIGRLILGDFDLTNYDLMLYFRLVSGFDTHHLTADNYLKRYPFSSTEAIEEKLADFTSLGYLTTRGEGIYQLEEAGKSFPHHYWAQISTETERLDLEHISPADLEMPFSVLQQILAAMRESEHPSGMFIFSQRMQGLHPNYDPPEIWHLWQYVWSMLAFQDDIRLWRSRQLEIAPLTWHFFWELRRSAQTLENLHRRTLRYAPVPDLELASRAALADLHKRGWIEVGEDQEGFVYELSNLGQRTASLNEEMIADEHIKVWPPLNSTNLERLQTFLEWLNHDLEEIISEG